MAVHDLSYPSTRSPKFMAAEVACYPIVRKFLAKNFTIPFVVAARENPYSNYLAACLDRNPSHRKYIQTDELTDRLPILVAGWRQKSGFGKVITPAAALSFNQFVLEDFMHRIMMQLVLTHINGKSVEHSAQMVIDRYCLTDAELSLDAMMTYYVLHRQSFLHLDQEHSANQGTTGRSKKGLN